MPEFIHRPVLLAEVVREMRPVSGGVYFDGTVGGGGHSKAILEASAPLGRVWGCDRDGVALAAARGRLKEFGDRVEWVRGRFDRVLEGMEPESLAGVLLDIGVSSPQLDWGERGFSFQREGPLDMRMDQEEGITAREWLRDLPEEEMARLFWEWGGESQSRRIAAAICDHFRLGGDLKTTGELARLVERVVPRRGGDRIHPATRVFQVVRMGVNDELGCLRRGLEAAWRGVKVSGRICVITFHSLEARVVKGFAREREAELKTEIERFPQMSKGKSWKVLGKTFEASEEEVRENPRARSAVLRVVEKL